MADTLFGEPVDHLEFLLEAGQLLDAAVSERLAARRAVEERRRALPGLPPAKAADAEAEVEEVERVLAAREAAEGLVQECMGLARRAAQQLGLPV